MHSVGGRLWWRPLHRLCGRVESYRGAVASRDSTGTSVGALARRGFGDATRAARLLAESGLADAAHEVIVDALCRAAENTIWFATVNCAGEGSPTTSAVARPDGTLFAWQPYGEEGLLLADIDLEEATGFLAGRLKPEA